MLWSSKADVGRVGYLYAYSEVDWFFWTGPIVNL